MARNTGLTRMARTRMARRGHRWAKMRKVAGDRPVWVTEYCFNGRDESPGLIRSAGEFWLAMTEAFNDGVNVWMAYDWVYPPRQGGEALIHLGWGREYTLTKIYHGFRQWCAPLRPGMRVARSEVTGQFASGIAQAGVKASAFRSADGRTLVVHIAAVQVQDSDADLEIRLGAPFDNARAACGAPAAKRTPSNCPRSPCLPASSPPACPAAPSSPSASTSRPAHPDVSLFACLACFVVQEFLRGKTTKDAKGAKWAAMEPQDTFSFVRPIAPVLSGVGVRSRGQRSPEFRV